MPRVVDEGVQPEQWLRREVASTPRSMVHLRPSAANNRARPVLHDSWESRRLHMDTQPKEYRDYLVSAQQRAQENFDKSLIAVSGGALGISFAFVKDIVGNKPALAKEFLLLAWISWGISITCVLFSFYFSNQAFREVIRQVDQNEVSERKARSRAGRLTAILNSAAGLLFLAGVIMMVIFVANNLS